MALFDFLKRKPVASVKPRAKYKRNPNTPRRTYRTTRSPAYAGVATSRKTAEQAYASVTNNLFSYVPRQYLELHNYDLSKLSALNSNDLLRYLVYMEPNVSHALSNYLRVFDSGFFLLARKPNGEIHQAGTDFLEALVNRLNHPASTGFIPDRSLTSLYLQFATHELLDGAIASEEEFNGEFLVQAIHSVDPATVYFKGNNAGLLVPYQSIGGDEKSLDYRNFFYTPVDPIGGDPYGTNQILSVIQPVMNKFRLLQDFARALHNLGFDRIDIAIDQNMILEACKARGISAPNEIVAEIMKVVDEAKTSMQNLEADDNPVHLDPIKLTSLQGRNSSTGVNVQAIVNVLLADIASGLKTYATILGKRFGGSTEGYTSMEGLLFIKLIQGFQAICKRVLDRVFTLALQVEGGIQAYADWQWLEPSLRPIYESAQYFAAYSLMLWEEEQSGSISRFERDLLVRKMLALKGIPPTDAERVEGFRPSGNQPTPQRDTSQETDKEAKRKETNRDRRTTGNDDTADEED